MVFDAVFSDEVVRRFLDKITAQQLAEMNEIYLITNPLDSKAPRKLRFDPVPRFWNDEWKPIENPVNNPRDFVTDENKRADKVYKYYLDHKSEYADVTSVDGQKRLGNATDEAGGSFLFHVRKDNDAASVKLKLAKGFLALAKAANRGQIEINGLTVVSMKFFPVPAHSRFKVSTFNSVDEPLMKKIEEVLAQNGCPEFSISFKTDVASFICWNQPESEYKPFAPLFRTRTTEIERLSSRMGRIGIRYK